MLIRFDKVDKTKFLGVILNENLAWGDHRKRNYQQ